MKNYALELASSIVNAHMYNIAFTFVPCDMYEIALYDENQTLLFGTKFENINFTKDEYLDKEKLYIVDKSAQLHLGVKYIVLEDSAFAKMQEAFLVEVIFCTVILLFFVVIMGYFLSKLFLRPIANERQMLDNFIQNTTHELNTPITALLMSVNSLKTEDNSPSMQRIKISANRILNIYSDLCYLLKNDLEINDEIITLNFKESIKEQIILMAGYIQSKNITIIENLENLQCNMDKESAQRLIGNLLSNALKYSKPNQNIVITLQNNTLTIEDYGIGIKPEALKNIKKRYFRADKSEGGFGIGLDIVNRICRKYGMSFTIDSTYKSGSVVKILFNTTCS